MRNDIASAEHIVKILKNASKVAVIWVLSTMFAIVLNHMGVRIENLLLILCGRRRYLQRGDQQHVLGNWFIGRFRLHF